MLCIYSVTLFEFCVFFFVFVFLQAEDGIRDLVRSRGLGDVYKRQALSTGTLQPVDQQRQGLQPVAHDDDDRCCDGAHRSGVLMGLEQSRSCPVHRLSLIHI